MAQFQTSREIAIEAQAAKARSQMKSLAREQEEQRAAAERARILAAAPPPPQRRSGFPHPNSTVYAEQIERAASLHRPQRFQ